MPHRGRRPLFKVLSFLLLIPAIGSCPPLLHSQDDVPEVGSDGSDLADSNLEDLLNIKVYGASRYSQTLSQSPASVSVITRDEIQRFGYRTLADALRSVPGFFITSDRLYSYAGVRGFDNPGDYNTRILLMVDGHRLNDVIFQQAVIGPEFPVDVDLIQRVEVIRGPASSIYGTNAVFAVVNVITRTTRELKGIEISSDAGSFNTYGGRVSYGGRVRGLQTVLSATITDSKGPNSLFLPAYDSATQNHGVATHADGYRVADLLATFSGRGFLLQAVYSPKSQQDPTGAWGTVFNNSDNRVRDTHGYVDLSYHHSTGPWDLLVRTYFDHLAEDGYYVIPGETKESVTNRDYIRGNQTGIQIQASRAIGSRLKIVGGLEYRDQFEQVLVNYNEAPDLSFLNVNIPFQILGVYFQGEIKLSNRLSITGGVRDDYYTSTGLTTNPRVSLNYQPWGKSAFRVVYGTAFRAPNTYELNYAGEGTIAAPSLREEQLKAVEADWEQQLTGLFSVAASVFHNRMNNFIELTTASNGNLTFHNVDHGSSTGAEIQLRGRLYNGVMGQTSYSYQEAVDGPTHAWLVGSPRHLVYLNLSIPVFRRSIFAGIEAQFMSKRKTLAETYSGAHAVVNATLLGRDLPGGWEFSASIYNLLNQKYSDPAAQQHLEDQLQQDGRNFRVKLAWRSKAE